MGTRLQDEYFIAVCVVYGLGHAVLPHKLCHQTKADPGARVQHSVQVLLEDTLVIKDLEESGSQVRTSRIHVIPFCFLLSFTYLCTGSLLFQIYAHRPHVPLAPNLHLERLDLLREILPVHAAAEYAADAQGVGQFVAQGDGVGEGELGRIHNHHQPSPHPQQHRRQQRQERRPAAAVR